MKTYVGNPTAARDYVEADRCRADDYYLAEGTGLARRFTAGPDGHVLELAPLAGDAYEAWVGGVDPDTGQARGRLRRDDRAVRFVEVTVNGPKSWSLAAELHPDIAAAYDAAQDRAAEQVIAWLAQHATTRVGPRGGQVQVPVEALEAVTVRHHTSRAGDPHRHLHLQVNARVFAAGQWRGLHTVGVRDSLNAINGIGHAAVLTDPDFRAALAAHGYSVDPGGEITQLAPYAGAFSKRADQIRRNLDRYERDWTATHPGEQPGPALRRGWDARAWAEARPDKVTPHPGADLNRRWLTELADLGYTDRDKPIGFVPVAVGGVDRDRAAAEILTRLGAARSAWNAPDILGEAELLLARTGIVTPAAVRTELAEDITARALTHCVALLDRPGVPEHIRALTSEQVLDVEADLITRLATRGGTDSVPVPGAAQDRGVAVPVRGLDAAQTAAARALAGDAALVVVQGAAGAGKTTTLAATAGLLDLDGHAMVVVTPTLKAARVAATELGTQTGSAAWFAYQHGWRWDDQGMWARLAPGDRDPVTGRPVALPSPIAQLRAGDLLVVDEAGMLDQDTARALLVIADEHHARLALIGDTHQLSAVGRGGVLELAERWAATCVTLDGVHRFTRTTHDTHGVEVTVPDTDYAELSLAMRRGEDPAAVFDQLHARGQVVVYPHPEDRTTHLADRAVRALQDGRRGVVVADTGEQVRELTAAIRAARVADGQVTDPAAATTAATTATTLAPADEVTAVVTVAGERIGVGDVVATRRNDHALDVANRDTWTVTAITKDGRLRVTGAGGPRTLTAGYVAEHVELAYASTVYGVQGDTTDTSDVVLSDHSSAASTYVAMTRGRQANTVHVVADTLDQAREQWVAAFARDRADLGPQAARADAERAAREYARPRPVEAVVGELRQAWTVAADAERTLARSRLQLERAVTAHASDRDHQREIAAITARQGRADQHLDTLTPQLRAAETRVERAAAALRDSLLSEWRADRAAAGEAARTVVAGPGRLWLHRRAVTDARTLLQDWADKWEPITGDLRTGRGGVVTEAYPSGFNDRYEAVITDYAHNRAEAAHPERAALATAVDTARKERSAAQRAEWDARNAHAYSGGGGGYDWAREIPRLEQVIATAEHDLDQAEHTTGRLERDPAILTQPRGYLQAARTEWAVDRELTADTVRQQAITAAARHDELTGWDHIRSTPTPQPAPERDHGISR